jgi:uncharacterized protein (DUF1778 family)
MKKTTINIRVNSEDKKFLVKIAKIKRQSLSSFLREVAALEARKILKKETKR